MTDGELSAGTRCGPYEITRLIAAGGQGEVYEAVHDFTDQRVALKCLHLRHAGKKDLKERMRMEAVLLCKLRHPSIVTVYNAGITDTGVVWIAMDLLRGRTLRDALLETPRLPLVQAIGYAVRVADGVQAAHDLGIVHRDLKPENVFVTEEGDIKVLDLGTAKFYGYGPRITDEMRTPGTPAYMSPEHLSGEDVDGRSDVYALGLILYEMLAGRHAFARSDGLPTDRELVALQFGAEPKPLSELARDVPTTVVAIVKKALSKSRDRRQASMSEFARALEETVPAVGGTWRPNVRPDALRSAPSAHAKDAPRSSGASNVDAARPAIGASTIDHLRTEPSPPPIEALGTGNVTLAFERDVNPAARRPSQRPSTPSPPSSRQAVPLPTTILTAQDAIDADLRNQATRTDPRGARHTPDPTTVPLESKILSPDARVKENENANTAPVRRRGAGRIVVVASAVLGMATAALAVVSLRERGTRSVDVTSEASDAALTARGATSASSVGTLAIATPAPSTASGAIGVATVDDTVHSPPPPAESASAMPPGDLVRPPSALPIRRPPASPISPRRASPARPSDAFVVPTFAQPGRVSSPGALPPTFPPARKGDRR